MAHSTTVRPVTVATLGLVAAVAGTAQAAIIATVPAPVIVDNGNGSVSSIVLTGAPGNDNVTTAGNANVNVNGKNFTRLGPIDIVFTTTTSGNVSEYVIAEGVTNNTGSTWTSYSIELGFGSGAGFTRSPTTDALDFDSPTFDPAPDADDFTSVALGSDLLVFSGGGTVVNGEAEAFRFSIDVPDGLTTFTLRQTPLIPEPATIGAAAAGLALLAARRRTR